MESLFAFGQFREFFRKIFDWWRGSNLQLLRYTKVNYKSAHKKLGKDTQFINLLMGVLKTSQSIELKCWWIMLNTNPKLTHSSIKQVDQKAAKVACESIIHQETEVEIFQFLYEVLTLHLLHLSE